MDSEGVISAQGFHSLTGLCYRSQTPVRLAQKEGITLASCRRPSYRCPLPLLPASLLPLVPHLMSMSHSLPSANAPLFAGAPLAAGAPLTAGAPIAAGAPLAVGALFTAGAPIVAVAPLTAGAQYTNRRAEILPRGFDRSAGVEPRLYLCSLFSSF